MTKLEIIEELNKLCQNDIIPIDSNYNTNIKYKPISEYLNNMSAHVKPETAANELINRFLRDMLGMPVRSEVNYDNSFVDVVISEEGIGNPVCIELKPLFKTDRQNNRLNQISFNYLQYQTQIQKYLRHRQIEYVILTNINKAYIFNRNAILDFKPFYETTLCDIFKDYELHENLWDTVRRYEDNRIQHNLDTEFFLDLKKWYAEFANVNFNINHISKEEIVVLFLNKFIFIKTLEDYGSVPYRFIQDEYEHYVYKWKAKGYDIVFRQYFEEIEKFFEMYYDTELFSSNFWDYIENTESNFNTFRKVFEQIIGLDAWSLTFGKGLVHYNYRQIDEDIFGKAYETWIAENRKDEGIFYTASTITDYMANQLVDTLFDENLNLLLDEIKKTPLNIELIEKCIENITNIRIIDSTSGSGSFLIKVLKAIYKKYEKIDIATQWASNFHPEGLYSAPDNIAYIISFREKMFLNSGSELLFISTMILNHIFATDKDPRAIDTAKTNIWKEAVKLNPRIYKYTRLDKNKIHILPNLEMNFISGDSLTDVEFEKQVEIIAKEFPDEIKRLFEIRNSYLKDPYNPSVVAELKTIKKIIGSKLKQEPETFPDSLLFPLEYFFCFFRCDGLPLPKEEWGFDGIISNPPWEAIKPVKKEFAKLDKYEMDVLHFTEWFADKLKNDDEFSGNWKKYTSKYTEYTEFLYSKYDKQGSGDPNFYKFFMERDFNLIKQKGYFCLLVPSGFQTDEGSDKLRDLLINRYHLLELSSFENRGYQEADKKHKTKLFPEVHPQYKFSIVFARKENINGNKHKFKAKFYLTDPKDLYNDNFIEYDIDKIKQFSPVNLSIMEFRSDRDYELCLKIKDEHLVFSETDVKLRREFDMTNDSNLFNSFDDIKKQKGTPFLRLFQGKMIHQYNSSYSIATYFIKENEARLALLKKTKHRIKRVHDLNKEEFEKLVIPDNLLMDYQTYRMVYRAIGRSTDERTLISSIVPPNVFIGNSMIHTVNIEYSVEGNTITYKRQDYSKLIYLMSLFNSLSLNYYIRNKISANLNMFYIYELPFANASAQDRQRIIELGFSLLYKKSKQEDFEELKNELGIEIDSRKDLAEIRAELEVLIAKNLYHLSYEDWEYLTSTFVFGGDSDTKAELDEIINRSKNIFPSL